jgi:ribosomal protein S20
MELLKEDRGVSRITGLYSNIVYEAIDPYVDEMLNNGKNDKQVIIINSSYIQNDIFGYEDDFLDYPVQKITVNLSLVNGKVPPSYPQGFDTSGAMYPFGKKKDGMSYITKRYDVNFSEKILDELSVVTELVMDLTIILDKVKFNPKETPKLKLELMSVIIHELNHGYEFWMRYQNKIDSGLKYALSYIELNKKPFTKKVYKKLNKFLYLLYWSLPYEQNAKVQELYPYVLKYDVNELKDFTQFKNIKDMANFNADVFYNELVSLIPDRQMNKVLDTTLKEFIKSYKKSHKQMEEVLDDDVIKKSNIRDIFKHYEKTIKNGGENMRKKILRLYSLKSQLKR